MAFGPNVVECSVFIPRLRRGALIVKEGISVGLMAVGYVSLPQGTLIAQWVALGGTLTQYEHNLIVLP